MSVYNTPLASVIPLASTNGHFGMPLYGPRTALGRPLPHIRTVARRDPDWDSCWTAGPIPACFRPATVLANRDSKSAFEQPGMSGFTVKCTAPDWRNVRICVFEYSNVPAIYRSDLRKQNVI